MNKTLASVALSLGIAFAVFPLPVLSKVVLRPVSVERTEATTDQLGLDEQIWGNSGQPGDRQALLAAIDNSLRYLRSPRALRDYRNYRGSGITLHRVIHSVERFRELVLTCNSPAELQAAVQREFVLYQSVGKDNQGTVFFTSYYEPVHQASRVPTAEFRYPLYRVPPNFESWRRPHPTRTELEGEDGLQVSSRLRGLEIAWLRDRLEAYLVQIQGSARLQMTNGTVMTVGYDATTNYPYTSIGRELIKDGKLPADGLTMPVLINYFRQNPSELNIYLPRNRRFIFFRETFGAPATGSIQVPITPERSIATDKSIMPPGALALIHTRVPFPTGGKGQMEPRLVSRYVLDQDTGSAIKGPGRVDYFMGTGEVAGDRAGVMGWTGQLYYLLLRE